MNTLMKWNKMKKLNRTQKIVLAVLAILDIVVIGGLVGIVIISMRKPPPVNLPPTSTPVPTRIEHPEWTLTPTETPRPTLLPRLTDTPTLTPTPQPTNTPIPTSSPTQTPTPMPIVLNNASFDLIMPNRIPGWQWDAYVNYKPGDELDTENSYAEPFFDVADDPARRIDGATLKVETIRWLKFRTWVHQTITVTPGISVYFQIKANAYSSLDRLIVKAGIDPTGAQNCYDALWGQEKRINQQDGIVTLESPNIQIPIYQEIEVERTPEPTLEHGEEEPTEPITDTLSIPVGRVTVCFFAEPTYPHVNNAAFFDQAELITE